MTMIVNYTEARHNCFVSQLLKTDATNVVASTKPSITGTVP